MNRQLTPAHGHTPGCSPSKSTGKSFLQSSQGARKFRARSPNSRANFFRNSCWTNAKYRDDSQDTQSVSSGLTRTLENKYGAPASAPDRGAPEQDPVLVTFAGHYIVMGSVCSDSKTMIPSRVVVDTSSGYNVIPHDTLPSGWVQQVAASADLPASGDANNNPLCVSHEVRLRIQLGDSTYPVRFIVVKRLACTVLLSTQFLDHHVDATKCKEHVLYLTRSIIPILGVGNTTAPLQEPPTLRRTPAANSESKPADTAKPPKAARIRLCKSLRLPPCTLVKAQVLTQSGGLVQIEPRPSVYQHYQVRVINGVHEVIPEEPLDLLLSNFSRVERQLPKGMVVAYAAPSPMALIA